MTGAVLLLANVTYTVTVDFELSTGKANTALSAVEITVIPEPLTLLGASTAVAFGASFRRQRNKKQKAEA